MRFDPSIVTVKQSSIVSQIVSSPVATYLTNQINNQSIIPSTDVIQLTLTLKMTTAQVVETSVTVNNNIPFQDYVHPDDQTQPTFDIYLYCAGFIMDILSPTQF